MNITTFNDPFTATIRGLYGEAVWRKWSRSPAFEYDVEAAREQALKDASGTEEAYLPFREIRICFLGRALRLNCFIRNTDEQTLEVFLLPSNESRRAQIVQVFVRVDSRDWRGTAINYYDQQTGRPAPRVPGHLESVDSAMNTGLARALCQFVTLFTFDVTKPTNYMAQVRPNKDGKSVEWTEARTHYVLIKHDDPRNREIASINGHGHNGSVSRMAHARRAHFKTLRSPRYRWKIGQRVFVRAAWVGPKEWEDKGSQQIYKILELTRPEAKLETVSA